MKYRYLIERGFVTDAIYCSLIEAGSEGREFGTLGEFDNAADAKLAAEADAKATADELRWKDPPKAWQPDALYVSQTLDDGVEENRDS